MNQIEATRLGYKLLARMKGAGWKLKVWENRGWHYAVSSGPLYVFTLDDAENTRFCALMSGNPDAAGTGLGAWGVGAFYDDPNKAVLVQVEEAERVVSGYLAVIARARQIVGGKKKPECKHSRTFFITNVTKAPLKDGHHTAFALLRCAKCGDFLGFPQENFELALTEGTEETIRNLMRRMAP